MYTELHLDVADGIATITLDRPDLRNAWTPEQTQDLTVALDAVASDDAVKVVVVTGSGGSFNVGGARAASGTSRDGPAPWERSRDAHRQQYLAAVDVIRRIHRMPKATIAVINGGCAGAGLALALASDFRIAASTARFNTAFFDHGIPGELGAIWFATRIVGPARALELFLLPERMGAIAMEDLGLVHRVVEPATLESAVGEIAARLAKAPEDALRLAKENIADAVQSGLDDYLARETERMLARTWNRPVPAHRI